MSDDSVVVVVGRLVIVNGGDLVQHRRVLPSSCVNEVVLVTIEGPVDLYVVDVGFDGEGDAVVVVVVVVEVMNVFVL